MSIVETTFAPSKKPYAIDWSTFEIRQTTSRYADGREFVHRTPLVRAVWVGRKNGATYVSSGWLRGFGIPEGGEETIAAFMTDFDTRYGGDAEARWNGHDLWAPGWTVARMTDEATRLDAILQALPDVPADHDGWYRLHDHTKTTRRDPERP